MKQPSIYAALSVLVAWSQLALTDQRVTPSELQGLAEQVSATRIENDIPTLAGFGTRHTLSETESDTRGIGAARRWIKASFETISRDCGDCLRVSTQSRVISGWRRIPEPTDVVIDNYLFGVSSIAEGGMTPPVVFPGPIGSVRYGQ